MRTIDAILADALANQKGELILRVLTWADQTAYNAAPTVPEHTWVVKKFDIGSTSASVELVTENDYTVSDFEVFIIERGVSLNGVEYPVQSGLFFVRGYQEDYGAIKISGSSYPKLKINIAAGDGTYQEVIEAFCTAIGKTAVFKNATDAWLAYQFLPTGKSLSLNKAELFENLLKQKYTILVYEESPNNLVFYNQDSYESSALKAIESDGTTLLAVATSGANGGLTSSNAGDWTPQSMPSFYNDVVYSSALDLWVAVGASVCATSADGITWTARTIPAGTYKSVAWSSSLTLFVAVGTDLCATSSDGITWTARTIGSGTWESVAWNGSLFVAVSSEASEKLAYSTNGIAWAVGTPTIKRSAVSATWQSVAWSPALTLFVAVADTGTNRVMTSPDGITWTARSAAEANEWNSVAWSPALTLFVAVSRNGTNRVMTSPDGITWTARSAAEANSWWSVVWSPALTLFVSVSTTGTNRVMTSPDGITWTARSAAEANSWYGVAWSPALTLFVAVALTGTNRVMTSPDGITWTARSAAEANEWRSVAWSPELTLFAAVASSGTNRVMTSPDGITWTARSAIEANGWDCVAWSPGAAVFMAVSFNGTNRVMTSSDGITWTAIPDVDANTWAGVVWSPELAIFAAVSTDGTNRVMTWNGGRFPNTTRSLLWGNSLFVAVGTNKCYTSADGVTWTSRTIPAGAYYGVTYRNSLFVAVGVDVVATSPDGITWTARTPAALNNWQDVIWMSAISLFVAVASDGRDRVMFSADGITWQTTTANADFDLSYLDGTASHIVRDQSRVHYLWRDESATLHTDGDTTDPQWNLGFLASTDTPPTTREDAYYKIYLQKAPVRLDITDGDKIHFTPYWSIDPTKTIDAMMQISEHLNLDKAPAWYQEIKSIIMFNSTEGGALPSTIERVAAYTPLVSTGFDGNLTPAVNNLQAFAQAVDDLPRAMTTTERDALSVNSYLIIFNTTTSKLNFWDGSAWRVVTSA